MVYTFAQENRGQVVNFFFLTVEVRFLPYLMLLVALVQVRSTHKMLLRWPAGQTSRRSQPFQDTTLRASGYVRVWLLGRFDLFGVTSLLRGDQNQHFKG